MLGCAEQGRVLGSEITRQSFCFAWTVPASGVGRCGNVPSPPSRFHSETEKSTACLWSRGGYTISKGVAQAVLKGRWE